MDLEEILKYYWNYSYFREGQLDIIEAVISGHDVLGLLPTGGGKSICYQVPGIYLGGVTIVVSPLIALIKDQVESLVNKGIGAKAIYSGMHYTEVDAALDTCLYDSKVRFLFISPERIQSEIFQERVKEMNVSLLVVDEAHCISQWGYDFRPSYLLINDLRALLSVEVPILALSASATPKVQKDIQEKLAFRPAMSRLFLGSFSRPNLSLNVRLVEDKQEKLIEVIRAIDGSVVVYVSSRKMAEKIAKKLDFLNIGAVYYHGGLSPDDRSKRQKWWVNNQVRVMVATNAFGMGIDKPDVRLVIHFQLPNALEAYYQEAGRAGRDGDRAFALCLFQSEDIQRLWDLHELSYPDFSVLDRTYNALCNFNKIALGVKLKSSVDFEIDELSEVYKIPVGELFYAIKRLEQLGLIATNDAFKNPSRIKIYFNRQELYRFQVANKDFANLTKSILRNYGANIFYDYLNVSEQLLANDLKIQKIEVERQLRTLGNLKVIDYQATNLKSQLTFIEERVNTSMLRKKYRLIEQLKSERSIGLKKMMSFLKTTSCRSQYLGDYFGFESDKCGVCDNCKTEKNIKVRTQEILDFLKNSKPQSLEQVHQYFTSSNIENIKHALRELYDDEKIAYKGGKIIAV